MASIREIKNRIGSVKFTQQITKAMKMVAASKLRKAQNKAKPLIDYSNKLSKILNNTFYYENEKIFNSYLLKKEIVNTLFIIISSDRGLCGSYNSNIFRKFNNHIKSLSSNIHVLVIGKKSLDFFKNKNFSLIKDYSNIWNNLSLSSTENLFNYVINAYHNNTYDEINIVYNKFKNATSQIPSVEKILPISLPEKEEDKNRNYFYYEPSKLCISESLIESFLKIKIYNFLLESAISEHSARMIAMGKATDNAKELLKDLKLIFNRTRQSAITKEMLEIVGGAEAIK